LESFHRQLNVFNKVEAGVERESIVNTNSNIDAYMLINESFFIFS